MPQTQPATGKVAVIVVHGVADQQPGATASSFVDLMVASPLPGGVQYVAGPRSDFTLAVPPLAPTLPFAFNRQLDDAALQALRHDATPTAAERGIGKSLRQSIKSDFHREADLPGTDRGLAYSQYLLHKAVRNAAPTEPYASQQTALVRQHGDGGRTAVDVFEMYWADQSRLSSALPRIVTEMFTLFFRLSRLGRDTVEEASRDAATHRPDCQWSVLTQLHTVIDWGFTNVLAQLFAQLLLVAGFLFAVGQAGPQATAPDGAPYGWTTAACTAMEATRQLCDHAKPTRTSPTASHLPGRAWCCWC